MDAEQPTSEPAPRGAVPEGYDERDFPAFAVTVDIVILTIADGELEVLLIERNDDPFKGSWALPGGFKRPDETLDEAAQRELTEETGVVAPAHLAQFGAYGDPGRDPRMNVVTVGYLAVTPEVGALAAGTDAADARMWPVDAALGGELLLAFDHSRLLRDAVERAAEDLAESGLAPAFLPPTFTLTELQSVYEALWGDELDAANFRRSLLAAEGETYVEPTGQRAPSSRRGGRPPQFYRAGDAWRWGSPVKRPRRRTD